MANIAIRQPNLLLPGPEVDLTLWPVVACDQYTSQPKYWQETEKQVGESPSTLQLILPEIYLGEGDEQRIAGIHKAMLKVLDGGLLVEHRGCVLVERTTDGPHGSRIRHGVVAEIDLEAYDYRKGSQSLIRATEGTILERIPPRVRVRAGAPLELPHIHLLIDDPQQQAIAPVAARKDHLKLLYDIKLLQGGGRVRGWAMDEAGETQLFAALENLADPAQYASQHHLGSDAPVLLFAVGDGNHSLATAKSVWETTRQRLLGEGLDLAAALQHPARWALVEVMNLHDPGLSFEPIHRVLFDVRQDPLLALSEAFGGTLLQTPVKAEDLPDAVIKHGGHVAGLCTDRGAWLLEFTQPDQHLPVATVQRWLDTWLAAGGAGHIDYVHGADVTLELGTQTGHAGLLLPAMPKDELFATVALDGALPRKTFSMGEPWEKRYYLECRKIL